MTVTLTLDSPEARRALAWCTRLLLRWATEDELEATVDTDDPDREATLTASNDAHQEVDQ